MKRKDNLNFDIEISVKVEDKEIDVGYVELTVRPDKLYLNFIGVTEKFRQQGIGSKMLKTVLSIADSLKVDCYCEPACLKDSGDNALKPKQLLKWYKRYGFKSVDLGKHVWRYKKKGKA